MAAARTAKQLVQVLLQASEKSAKIARAWRCQEELFALMVEEKTGKEKNKRFIRDFKTLADVLVQELVKHDVIMEVSSIVTVLGRSVYFSRLNSKMHEGNCRIPGHLC